MPAGASNFSHTGLFRPEIKSADDCSLGGMHESPIARQLYDELVPGANEDEFANAFLGTLEACAVEKIDDPFEVCNLGKDTHNFFLLTPHGFRKKYRSEIPERWDWGL